MGVVTADGPDGALVRVRALPGARREGLAGVVGDRLKVKVSAPAEGGRANASICGLVAAALGVRAQSVRVERGATSAEKTLRVEGIDAQRVMELLGV